ncbi:MAG: gas vesicle protein [Actinopolymorphaceae bacterium]
MTARPEYRRTGTAPVSRSNDSLADILERVLDKGIVIAGDIMVNVLDIELLTLKVRLLIASVDTARDMGIDWWTTDPFLTGNNQLAKENRDLKGRVEELERQVRAAGLPSAEESPSAARQQVRAVSHGAERSDE